MATASSTTPPADAGEFDARSYTELTETAILGPLAVVAPEGPARDALCNLLQRNLLGVVDIVIAGSLAEATEALASVSVDALFVDLALPDARGREVIGRLAEVSPTSAILVLSARDDVGHSLQCVKAGAQDVIHADTPEISLIRMLHNAVERKRAQSRLSELAHYDQLTGLPNRAFFMRKLTSATKRGCGDESRFALLYLDLDGFKQVNDTLGHSAGDKVLVETAKRLQSTLRDSDIIARLGGDEFAVILAGAEDERAAISIARKLHVAISQPYDLDGPAAISSSIGVALFPDHGGDPSSLVEAADSAMYEAKRGGKGRHQIYEEEDETPTLSVVTGFDEAAFDLRYEPIVDLLRDQMIGVRAAARWRHPRRGPIEGLDLTAQLAHDRVTDDYIGWLVQHSCQQLAKWSFEGSKVVPVTVELSHGRAVDPNFRAWIARVLDKVHLRSEHLDLSCSGDLLRNPYVADAMGVYRHHGHRVVASVETAESVHALLCAPPCFDVIALSPALVHEAAREEAAQTTILTACREMTARGGVVIASGIATSEQLVLACNLGCGYATGLMFSRALAATAISGWLDSEGEWEEPTHFG